MKKYIAILFFLASVILACTSESTNTPKPKGYFRINFPKKQYQTYDAGCPFTFDYPVYAKMVVDSDKNAQPCWNNLDFPQFNGQLHLTYYDVLSEKEYNQMTEAARTLAMKHTIKADAIDQKIINYPDKKVYGIYYAIDGNTASSVQFFLTDSSKHYFRGALYFNERPQYDSIQPVVKFIKKDIDRMIETFRWKNSSVKSFAIQKNTKSKAESLKHNTKQKAQKLANLVIDLPTEKTNYSLVSYSYGNTIDTSTSKNIVLANQFLNNFRAKQFDSLAHYFDPVLAAQLTPAMMADAYKGISAQFGELQTGTAVETKSGAYQVVKVPLLNEAQNLAFQFTFNSAHQMLGFTFVPKKIVSYKDPAYADRNLYIEEKITVATGDFKMPGIYTKPANTTTFPIVILVHGSGPGDKDETMGNTKPFRDLALGLAAKGIATIRYDKRTKIYKAKSAPEGVTVTVKEEVVDDVLSAIKLAQTLPGADPQKIYVLGHSLGALLAPKIATESKDLAGIIMMSAPARSLSATIIDQFNYLIGDKVVLEKQLAIANEIAHADTIKNQQKPIMGATAAYFTNLNAYNQVQTAKKLKLPILILQGERDYQVTLKDLAIWKSELEKNKNVTIKSYAKLNHAYTEGEGALSTPAEYEIQANMPLYVIEDLASWILKK